MKSSPSRTTASSFRSSRNSTSDSGSSASNVPVIRRRNPEDEGEDRQSRDALAGRWLSIFWRRGSICWATAFGFNMLRTESPCLDFPEPIFLGYFGRYGNSRGTRESRSDRYLGGRYGSLSPANYQIHTGSFGLVRAESPLILRGCLSHRVSYAFAMSRRRAGTSGFWCIGG